MTALEAEIVERWNAMFRALAAGQDVAPASRLRTEGLMEAAVLQQLAEPEALLDQMEASYRAAFDRSIADDFGERWRELFPFPQIPAVMRRAPVYSSTRS